jgi:hypothetical protein
LQRNKNIINRLARGKKKEKKMGLFGLLGKKESDAIVKSYGIFRCPYCNQNFKEIIDKEALPVYEVFKKMGPLAGSVTMDTARNQFIYEQGITCSCGQVLKPCKK